MDQIRIDNLIVFANHGVFPEETVLGQKFVISCVLDVNTRQAGLNDDLERSVHYGFVAQDITEFLQQHTYKLLEAAAENLARHLLIKYPLIRELSLTVAKPWAPVHLPLDTVSVTIRRARHRAFIALGSNIGDSRALLDEAIRKLNSAEDISVRRVSSWIITKPYGVTDQPDFLNGCAELETLLEPEELLHELNRIEQEAGRERLIHWGPRTLDLDLLFYDDEIIGTDILSVPHPEIEKRSFVLVPMVEIAPYYRHPVSKLTMKTLLEQLKEG